MIQYRTRYGFDFETSAWPDARPSGAGSYFVFEAGRASLKRRYRGWRVVA